MKHPQSKEISYLQIDLNMSRDKNQIYLRDDSIIIDLRRTALYMDVMRLTQINNLITKAIIEKTKLENSNQNIDNYLEIIRRLCLIRLVCLKRLLCHNNDHKIRKLYNSACFIRYDLFLPMLKHCKKHFDKKYSRIEYFYFFSFLLLFWVLYSVDNNTYKPSLLGGRLSFMGTETYGGEE